MTKSPLNLGSIPNDNTGDPLRIAGQKINDNFDEIYSTFGDGTTLSSNVETASTASGLSGEPDIQVGIVTATSGFISTLNATPIQIFLDGNELTFSAVGIGSTTFTIS
jgi:hypothetical protein